MDEIRLGSRTLKPRRELLVGGRHEPLGKRALDILSTLAEAKGEIVTKDELLEAVWPGVIVEENALQVHIVALRKALGPEAERLRTIRGVGYQLALDGKVVEPRAEATAFAPPGDPGLRRPAVSPAAAWSWARSHRPAAMAVAALLLLLVGAWAVIGGNLGLRSQERIPVVVRALAATTSGDPAEVALASGVTDELIIRLRRLKELRLAKAESDGSVPGETFKSAYVVDGSIRRDGGQVRVTARLTSAAGEVLWSQTFDRPLADLLNVQEAIATAIADALSVSLDVGTNATEYGGTDNPEAFAAYMQGSANRLGDTNAAIAQFERAAAIDPNYVKAYTALVTIEARQMLEARDDGQARVLLDRMDKDSARALAANPGHWLGHFARGTYYLNRKELSAADKEMKRVAELDPGDDGDVPAYLFYYALSVGRAAEADSLARSVALISGVQSTGTTGFQFYTLPVLGRYDETIAMFKRLPADLQRSLSPAAFEVYLALLASGRDAEAAEFARGIGDGILDDRRRAFRAEPDLARKSSAELERWVARQGGSFQWTAAMSALFASHYGQPRLAVDLMRLAQQKPGGTELRKLWHPLMAEARETDEFEKLVTDLGFAKMWRESGDWGDFCHPVSSTEISCH